MILFSIPKVLANQFHSQRKGVTPSILCEETSEWCCSNNARVTLVGGWVELGRTPFWLKSHPCFDLRVCRWDKLHGRANTRGGTWVQLGSIAGHHSGGVSSRVLVGHSGDSLGTSSVPTICGTRLTCEVFDTSRLEVCGDSSPSFHQAATPRGFGIQQL